MGQSKLCYFPLLEDAKKDFEKKFRDKTKNSWAERDHFVAHPGKYTLIEVQGEDKAQEAVVKVKGQGEWEGPGLRESAQRPSAWALPLPAGQPQAQTSPLWPGPASLKPVRVRAPGAAGCPTAPALYVFPLPLGGRPPSEDCGSAGAAMLPGCSHTEAHHQHLQQGHVQGCHGPHEPG